MTLSARSRLAISLGVITLNWVLRIPTSTVPPHVPGTMGELVWAVVRDKVSTLVVIFFLLWLQKERVGQLGVTKRDWLKHILIGCAYGTVMFIALNVVLTSVLESFIPKPPANGPSIMALFADSRNLIPMLLIGIFGGGFVEELERVFQITRFEQWKGRTGLTIGVVVSSIMFGAAHLYQGLAGAISIVVSGLAFSLLYLRRRSALEPIAAHAFSDVLAMVAATMMAK